MVQSTREYRKHARRKAHDRQARMHIAKRQNQNPDIDDGDNGQSNGRGPGGKGKGGGRPGGPRGPGQRPPGPPLPPAEHATTTTAESTQTTVLLVTTQTTPLPASTTSVSTSTPLAPQILSTTPSPVPGVTTAPQIPLPSSILPPATFSNSNIPPATLPVMAPTRPPVSTQQTINSSPILNTDTTNPTVAPPPPNTQPIMQPAATAPTSVAPTLPLADASPPQQSGAAPLGRTSTTFMSSILLPSIGKAPMASSTSISVRGSMSASRSFQTSMPVQSMPMTPTAYPAAESPAPEPILTRRSKIGIGVGVSIFGLLLLFSILLFCLRRRKRRIDQDGSGSFSGYDPQHVYLGGGGEAGMAAKRAMQENGLFSPSIAARDFGHPGEDEPFRFRGVDQRMTALGLCSHPVGAHNTLEEPSFPFDRPVSSSASIVTPQGPLVVVGGLGGSFSTPSRDSLTDPDCPNRTRPPSAFEGFVANGTRPSITPSESISRVMEGGGAGGARRPSSPIARYVEELTRPTLAASVNIAHLLGFARRSATINPSSNATSIAELPAPTRRKSQSITPSNFSWPMPPGMVKGWMGSLRRKSKAVDGEKAESRWSSTQPSRSEIRGESPAGSENSRDELITALPEIVTALPEMREKRDTGGPWEKRNAGGSWRRSWWD